MMELALEGDSDLIPTLQNELMTVRMEADIQASRAVNLDRENRELKAFINQYCNNNTANVISSVYADPMLGIELNHFREGYMKLVGMVDPKAIQSVQQQNEEMRRNMGDTYIQNLQKLIASKDDEINLLKKALNKSELDNKTLKKDNENLKAKAFLSK